MMPEYTEGDGNMKTSQESSAGRHNDNEAEIIGVLHAISVVSKRLARRLADLDCHWDEQAERRMEEDDI